MRNVIRNAGVLFLVSAAVLLTLSGPAEAVRRPVCSPIVTPAVTGQTVPEATVALENAGFYSIQVIWHSKSPDILIQEQTPLAGALSNRCALATITTAQEPVY
jgi:hypothetical protein